MREKPISLAPLKFKEAVADLLKVKPPPRPERAEKPAPANRKKKVTSKKK